MKSVILLSVILGFLWNAIVVYLMGGRMNEFLYSSFTAAGVLSGTVAGLFTVWSRRRTLGEERFAYVLANYFVVVFAYWLSFVVIERAWLCMKTGGWTDFDLRDNLILIYWLLLGSIWYSVLLVPLCYLSRYAV